MNAKLPCPPVRPVVLYLKTIAAVLWLLLAAVPVLAQEQVMVNVTMTEGTNMSAARHRRGGHSRDAAGDGCL